jgi:hypothetical protein
MANPPHYNAPHNDARRQRAEYNRELWRGGIVLLLLLLFLNVAILNSHLQPFEPFLGLGIGVIIMIISCRLIITSHRDAKIARSSIRTRSRTVSLERESERPRHLVGDLALGGLAVAAVVLLIITSISDAYSNRDSDRYVISGVIVIAVLWISYRRFLKQLITDFVAKIVDLWEGVKDWRHRDLVPQFGGVIKEFMNWIGKQLRGDR